MPEAIERLFAILLLASRWLMAPFYLGLIAVLAILLVEFCRELVLAAAGFAGMSSDAVILAALKLTDLVLVGNLLLIMIGAGLDTVLSQEGAKARLRRPDWMGKVDFTALKLKVVGSVIAIAAVDLLENFFAIESLDKDMVVWSIAVFLALVEMLTRHGVDTLFALPGVQNDALFVALYDAGEAIRVIHPRHEQAAAYMAFGYARASGRPGAFAVVPRPGLLNTTAALATAYATNTPVLCISGQIPSDLIGRGFGLLHEIPDQLAILRGLTKWAGRINHPSETGYLVDEAFRQLRDGRPRPVALEMPLDIMALESEVALPDAEALPPPPPPDPELIAEAATLLAAAKRPMIYVGSGCADAASEVLTVAE